MQNNKREFVLVDKKPEAADVTSLFFKPTDGLEYDYQPGQYVDIKPSSVHSHGKSYTISSIPSDEFVSLTIKKSGTISTAMLDMRINDKVIFDGPHGNFYPENPTNNIVMLAGGIGITPFFSIIKNMIKSGSDAKITLIYSNKTKNDITFFGILNKLACSSPNLEIVYCLTQEKVTDLNINEFKRIDQDIINKYAPHLKNTNYYICGSIKFTSDMWRTLKSMNIDEDDIFTEAFF